MFIDTNCCEQWIVRVRKNINTKSNEFSFIAFSLAASMFESSGGGGDNGSLSDTDTELYILGVKYKTPIGEWLKFELILY